eukprot:jgi/Psemu1/15734/gm1.15734_g
MSESKDNKTDKTEGDGEGSVDRKPNYQRKGGRKKQSNVKFESSGNTFKGPNLELKEHVFIEAFISYAGGKYGKDVRATLTEISVTITMAKVSASHNRETIKALTPSTALLQRNLKTALNILFDKLWAQCGLVMQNKVKSHIRWKSAVKKSDVIKLLEIIDEICSSGNQSKYAPADNQQSLTEYDEEFGMLVRMVKQHRNAYSMSDIEELIIRSQTDPNTKGKSMSELSTDIQEVISENAREVYLPTIFIMNPNNTKCGAYKQLLYNNYCHGDN